ncbi:MAG: hypothetical protein DMF51_10660 [Acidobacteria bacterium]|nr:MAG: hypothetical protein DMF51_10660 [Acidobacteriota bacterium]
MFVKRVLCAACGTEGTASDMFDAEGQALCQRCVEEAGRGKRVERMIDSTICARCGRDEGSRDLPRLGRLPFCEDCTRAVRNVPYPNWLRYAFLGLLMVAALAFVRNQRFFSAYAQLVRAGRDLKTGRFDQAVSKMESAARMIPESADMAAEVNFLKAIQFVQQDRSADAVPLLRAYVAAYPGDANAKKVLLQAEIGAAFESADYEAFLEKSLVLAGQEPNDPRASAGVASAYACKYAVKGEEEFARQARERLEAARKLAPPADPDFEEYSQRIEYRLATREIISRTEYHRRFPNGWRPEGSR